MLAPRSFFANRSSVRVTEALLSGLVAACGFT
jgi:hypothetical protein